MQKEIKTEEICKLCNKPIKDFHFYRLGKLYCLESQSARREK